MSTLLVTMSIDPHRLEEARRHLREDVLGWASSQPGFLRGHWYANEDNTRGYGVVDFDTAQAAHAAADGPRGYTREASRAWNVESVDVLNDIVQA